MKKKRRPKLAPRYTQDKDVDATKEEEIKHAFDTQQAELVRDVFTSATCRCFVLKSFSEANFHMSLKFGKIFIISTDEKVGFYPTLFFICRSKHFSGVARMTSNVQMDYQFQLWEKSKYEGFFHVEWLLVKDVPNYVLTGIKMKNTPTKKSITSCRDCEEVLYEEAHEFLSLFTQFKSRSSAWDDFAYYDELQTKLEHKRGLILPDGVDKTDLNSYLVPVRQEDSTL